VDAESARRDANCEAEDRSDGYEEKRRAKCHRSSPFSSVTSSTKGCPLRSPTKRAQSVRRRLLVTIEVRQSTLSARVSVPRGCVRPRDQLPWCWSRGSVHVWIGWSGHCKRRSWWVSPSRRRRVSRSYVREERNGGVPGLAARAEHRRRIRLE
jgi:hypothetical protein